MVVRYFKCIISINPQNDTMIPILKMNHLHLSKVIELANVANACIQSKSLGLGVYWVYQLMMWILSSKKTR